MFGFNFSGLDSGNTASNALASIKAGQVPAINPALGASLQTIGLNALTERAMAALGSSSIAKVAAANKALAIAGNLLQDPTAVRQPLLGLATLGDVRDHVGYMNKVGLSRKNLWFVRITEQTKVLESVVGQDTLNMFATACSYSYATLTGDRVMLSGANMDRLTGVEHVDLSIQVMDSAQGILKTWFDLKVAQACNPDGTFGLPKDYLVTVEVVHASPIYGGDFYVHQMRMRPVSMTTEKSRSEGAMEEHTMTFTQFDTWM